MALSTRFADPLSYAELRGQTPYALLCDAREMLACGKRRIIEACERRGAHVVYLIDVGAPLDEATEQIDEAIDKLVATSPQPIQADEDLGLIDGTGGR